MNTKLLAALQKERGQAKMYLHASKSVKGNELTREAWHLLEEKLGILESYVQILEEQIAQLS